MHSLNLLANKIISLSPDVVVINHNVNDLSILLNTGTYFNQHPKRSLILTHSDQLNPYKVGYPKNWFVRTFIPHISLVLLPTTFEGQDIPKNNEFSKDALRPDLNIDSLKQLYSKSLTGLVNYAKSWNVQPVLMTQASCFKEFEVENIEKFKGYNLIVPLISMTIISLPSVIILFRDKLLFIKRYYLLDTVILGADDLFSFKKVIIPNVFDQIITAVPLLVSKSLGVISPLILYTILSFIYKKR